MLKYFLTKWQDLEHTKKESCSWCYDHGWETMGVLVAVVGGLKGLVKSKDRPCTTYPCGKCIPHLEAWERSWCKHWHQKHWCRPWQSDHLGKAKAMKNISKFEKIPKMLMHLGIICLLILSSFDWMNLLNYVFC